MRCLGWAVASGSRLRSLVRLLCRRLHNELRVGRWSLPAGGTEEEKVRELGVKWALIGLDREVSSE